MRTIRRLFLTAGILILASGCAVPQPKKGPTSERPQVTVEVDNSSWDDARIYAVTRAGGRYSVGTIGSLTTRRFRVNHPAGGEFGFIVRIFVTGEMLVLGPIPVQPDQVVRISLYNHREISSVTIISGE